MAVREIVLLGNPLLLSQSTLVRPDEKTLVSTLHEDLRDTARAFNHQHGWGRAISAVQIGVAKRIIYVDAPEKLLLINPEMFEPSESMIEIWDDCMSFPDLLVKVHRHQSFYLRYWDEHWQPQQRLIEGQMSELLQHELDHLDGIVATMRAVDGSQFALQSQKQFLDQGLLANQV